MRLRLDSDARAISALESAAAATSDNFKDLKSQLLQATRKMDVHDKKMLGFEGKVRWVEEHSSSAYVSPISSGVSSPAMLRTLEKQRSLHTSESLKDSEQIRAQVIKRIVMCFKTSRLTLLPQLREIENFVASLDTKFRDLALRVTKNDDSAAERIHALVSDTEDAVNQARQDMLSRLEDRVAQLNGVMQEVVAVSDEHSNQLQLQIKESHQSSRQICSTLGHRVEELESWRNTLRQSFDFQGSRTHDSAVHSSLDSFSASSNLSSSRGASGDRLHLRSLLAKDLREDDQSRRAPAAFCALKLILLESLRPISSRLSSRPWRNQTSANEPTSSSRSASFSVSARFAQRPEQAIDRSFVANARACYFLPFTFFRDLAEVKRLLGV